jgi:hypothetical protein
MTLTFASAADVSAEFRTTVTVFGILVLVIAVAFALSARNSPLAMTFKTRCVLGLLAFMGVVWYAYSSTYEQFITADVNGNEARLVFVGPFSRQVVLQRSQIVAVRWGETDRGSSRCRVSIEAAASKIYHSAWLPGKPDICKGLRDDILRTLQLDRRSE